VRARSCGETSIRRCRGKRSPSDDAQTGRPDQDADKWYKVNELVSQLIKIEAELTSMPR
jgi:hypothetical protein